MIPNVAYRSIINLYYHRQAQNYTGRVILNMLRSLVLLTVVARSLWGDFATIREFLRRGQFEQALEAAERDLKVRPKDFQIWTLKGVALQSMGRRPESISALRRAVALQPKFLPALQALAQVEYESGDPAAVQTLEQVVARNADPSAHAMLGVLAFEAKDCKRSVDHFSKAGAAATENPVARWQFASCLFEQGRAAEAEIHFSDMLSVREHPGIRYNLALTRFATKRFADAIAVLEPLAREAFPDADALSLLAAAYESSGQTPRAVETLRRAIELHPKDERLYADLAGICLDHHSLAVGVEVLEVGAKNNPGSARIQTILGVLLDRSGAVEKAAAAYERAIPLAPEAGFGAVAQAMTMLQMGAAGEAVKLLRQQRTRGGGAKVDIALAQALMQQELTDASAREAEALLSPPSLRSDAKAQALLAKLYLRRNDVPRATKAFEAALAVDANDRTAAYQLMTIYKRQGQSADVERMRRLMTHVLDTEKKAEAQAGRYRVIPSPDRNSQ